MFTLWASEGLRYASLTALYLVGGLTLGLTVVLPISAGPEQHVVRDVVAGGVMLAVLLIASRAWGRAMASRAECPDPGRVARVAALAFGPMLIVVGIGLGLLEPLFVRIGAARGWSIHVVFTLLFVPSAFLVASVTAFAMGSSLKNVSAGVSLALQTGAAAAAAFLAVDIFMDSIGWRVGGPGAARRATMLVVTFLGSLGAALAGGAVLGLAVARVSSRLATRDG